MLIRKHIKVLKKERDRERQRETDMQIRKTLCGFFKKRRREIERGREGGRDGERERDCYGKDGEKFIEEK